MDAFCSLASDVKDSQHCCRTACREHGPFLRAIPRYEVISIRDIVEDGGSGCLSGELSPQFVPWPTFHLCEIEDDFHDHGPVRWGAREALYSTADDECLVERADSAFRDHNASLFSAGSHDPFNEPIVDSVHLQGYIQAWVAHGVESLAAILEENRQVVVVGPGVFHGSGDDVGRVCWIAIDSESELVFCHRAIAVDAFVPSFGDSGVNRPRHGFEECYWSDTPALFKNSRHGSVAEDCWEIAVKVTVS